MRSERSPEPTCDLRSAARSASARAFQCRKAGAQHGHGVGAVLVLGFFAELVTMIPVGRWVMRTAESVVFTCAGPGAAGAHGVDADVAGGNVDIDLLGLGRTATVAALGMDAAA